MVANRAQRSPRSSSHNAAVVNERCHGHREGEVPDSLFAVERNAEHVPRVAGVFLVALNAIGQIVWFPAAPLWAFLMIVLDTIILYQLTMNWSAAEDRR